MVPSCLVYTLGVRKVNVVIILSPNSILFPIVSLSVMSLGTVISTTNPINTPVEISNQIGDSRPVLAFTTSQLVSNLSNSNLPVVLIDENRVVGAKIVRSLEAMMETEPSESRAKQRVNQDDTAPLLSLQARLGRAKDQMISGRRYVGIMSAELVGNYGPWDYFYELESNKFGLMRNYIKTLQKHPLSREPPPRRKRF
ncbi:hypothetical protein Bca52824_001217 [Brassica carinata]|uniref:AMP-dependent synthetase/ligase domain-containing protein n=1 Tax=Brassica carinata TaxID=52824 RepID=A0A8X8BCW2_BRACI|nr:hypothetical protein Bca52824_001217 [Brassica carinata]